MKVTKNRFANVILSTFVILFFGFPILSRADYIYRYTSNSFSASYFEVMQYDNGVTVTEEVPFDTFINAEIRTNSLLEPGSTINNIDSLSFSAGFINDSLFNVTYPGPSPSPSDYNPIVGASLNIGTIDTNGLPTIWDIIIDQYAFYGGRGHDITLETSSTGDVLMGYDEPYIAYRSNQPTQSGTWQLVISSVPEPRSCLMFIAGLGVIGAATFSYIIL